MNVTWNNSLGKVCFWGFCGILILKVTYMSYLGKVFVNLTNKIQSFQRLKNFRRFRVFVWSYRANPKGRNDGKFRELHFSVKLMNGGAIFMGLYWSFR